MTMGARIIRECLLTRLVGPPSVLYVIPMQDWRRVSRAFLWLLVCQWPGYDQVEWN